MMSILDRFLPRTLSSRLIVLAALLLLAGQMVSFFLLLNEHGRQSLTLKAAPAVMRIVDHLDRESAGFDQRTGRRDMVQQSLTAPRLRGVAAPDIATRATQMLHNAGIDPKEVRAFREPDLRHGPSSRVARIMADDSDILSAPRPQPHERLRLSVHLADGKWLTASSWIRRGPPPFARSLLLQTLLIYAAVLMPLLWIGRRLSAPLRDLTGAARTFSPVDAPSPLEERGPGDIRDLTQAFNGLQARIAGMLAEKDHMLGAIGHDLRTPLAALRVRVESVDDDAERESMVASIDEMRQMLEDILALASVGRDRQPPQKIDLGALAEAVTDDFIAIGADVSIVDGERCIVAARPPAVRRALRNLIDNAVKYGTSARVSLKHIDGKAALIVEDDGPGIAPDRIAEMLEPFSRMEPSRNRKTGGAGLGLALARAVMRAEGGALRLSNRTDGQGLVAELILPLA